MRPFRSTRSAGIAGAGGREQALDAMATTVSSLASFINASV
jgi:hypothetical protein